MKKSIGYVGLTIFLVISMIIPTYGVMNRPVKEEPAILLVAFGTSYPEAQASFDNIKEIYEKEFPNTEIRMAFTSDFIRRKILKRDGIFIDNPLTALATLNDEGYVNVVVQPLHVMNGEEYHDLLGIVDSLKMIDGKFAFNNLEIGDPLLTSMDDYEAVSAALASQFDKTTDENRTVYENPRDPDEVGVVLMGHGTVHFSNSAYSQMAKILESDYDNVFMGTVEGYPTYEDVLEQAKESGVTKLRLMPFMIVAGDHATNDLAGDEDDSWKSMFESEGFETDAYLKGMGNNDEIVGIYVEHTKAALDEFEE
ncbi:MAG: sirohydrochlorin cobaltochelatase [Methanotrichaceae archaeon]